MAEKDQTFSFDTVAVLVATIMANGGSLGNNEFRRMSALDGTRGEHGFNHMFRKVKARAKELNDLAKTEGGELTSVKKTKAAPAKKSAGRGAKRARKPKKGQDGEDDEEAKEESPTKRVKTEPKEEGSDADAPGDEDEF